MPGKIKSTILLMTRKKLERTKTNAIKEHQKKLKEIKESQTYQNKKANVSESKESIAFSTLKHDLSRINASLKKQPKGSALYSQLSNSKNIVESAINIMNLRMRVNHYRKGYIEEHHPEIENIFSAKFSLLLCNITMYQEHKSYAEVNTFVKKTMIEFNNFEKSLKSKLISKDVSENKLRAFELLSGFVDSKNKEIVRLIK